VFWGLTIHVTR